MTVKLSCNRYSDEYVANTESQARRQIERVRRLRVEVEQKLKRELATEER